MKVLALAGKNGLGSFPWVFVLNGKDSAKSLELFFFPLSWNLCFLLSHSRHWQERGVEKGMGNIKELLLSWPIYHKDLFSE